MAQLWMTKRPGSFFLTFARAFLSKHSLRKMKSVGVFCGSSVGIDDIYSEVARELGRIVVQENLTVIYGGGNVGLMGILADIVLESGGKIIGVMPEHIVNLEIAHENLSQLHIVRDMQERKTLMAKLSDGFITLPGGIGTLDELAEMMSYNQLRISDKPIGILNVNNYFERLLYFFDHAVEEGFIRAEHRNNLIVEEDVKTMIQKLRNYEPVGIENWINEIKNEKQQTG